MEEVNRQVGFVFVAGTLLLSWVAWKLVESVFGLVAPTADLSLFAGFRLSLVIGFVVGLATGFYAWGREAWRTFVVEVVVELRRVTWPSNEEARVSTIQVIALAVTIAVLLGVIDQVWRYLTDLLLNV
jgi:preprotein translocase subunit SecE